MTFVIPRISHVASTAYNNPCCLTHKHDAHHLARAAALVAPPGVVLDIGCGAGGVAIPLLHARADLCVVGVEVSRPDGDEAVRRATVMGIGRRFRLLQGDALTVDLPSAPSVTVNPPMLPTEPWFAVRGRDGREELFVHAMFARLARRPATADIWIHLFDYQGIDRSSGTYPALAAVAAREAFEISYPHRGWRAIGPASAIRVALPALARLFPDAIAVADGREVRFTDLMRHTPTSLLIRHSIVRLHRPGIMTGRSR
jgi:SAM-dependent methyltransferase